MILREMKCPECQDGTLGYMHQEDRKFHVMCCNCGYENVIPRSEVYILIHSREDDKPVQFISHNKSEIGLIEIFDLVKKTSLDGERAKQNGDSI